MRKLGQVIGRFFSVFASFVVSGFVAGAIAFFMPLFAAVFQSLLSPFGMSFRIAVVMALFPGPFTQTSQTVLQPDADIVSLSRQCVSLGRGGAL